MPSLLFQLTDPPNGNANAADIATERWRELMLVRETRRVRTLNDFVLWLNKPRRLFVRLVGAGKRRSAV
jgi:hypothetical protein